MSTDLGRRFDAIRRTMKRRGLALGPTASEASVAEFEREAGIRLPESYRRFLLEVGDGGKGPPVFGVAALEELPGEFDCGYDALLGALPRAFPHTEDADGQDLGDEQREDDEADAARQQERQQEEDGGAIDGFLPLGTDGCGAFYGLIVTGPERGNVWLIDSSGYSAQGAFVEWWEAWLGLEPSIPQLN